MKNTPSSMVSDHGRSETIGVPKRPKTPKTSTTILIIVKIRTIIRIIKINLNLKLTYFNQSAQKNTK